MYRIVTLKGNLFFIMIAFLFISCSDKIDVGNYSYAELEAKGFKPNYTRTRLDTIGFKPYYSEYTLFKFVEIDAKRGYGQYYFFDKSKELVRSLIIPEPHFENVEEANAWAVERGLSPLSTFSYITVGENRFQKWVNQYQDAESDTIFADYSATAKVLTLQANFNSDTY